MYRLYIRKDGKDVSKKLFNYWNDVKEAYPNLKFKKNRDLGRYEATDGAHDYHLYELIIIGSGFQKGADYENLSADIF